jgi:hypothetical protein
MDMKKIFVFFLIAAAIPFASLRADDQGPVQKTTSTVKKVTHETSDAIVNGAKATGRTISNGAKATGRTVGKGLQKAGNTVRNAGNSFNNRQG